MIVIIFVPLLTVAIFFYSTNSARDESMEIAQEIQTEFNGHYPETLAGYEDWKPESSYPEYTSVKKIGTSLNIDLWYRSIQDGKSFEISFLDMVDIYSYRPANGTIQEFYNDPVIEQP